LHKREHQLWIERERLEQIEWKAKKEREEREMQKQVIFLNII
jgi:hypothetical protein